MKNEKTNEELKQERIARLKKLAKMEIDDAKAETSVSAYNAKFNKLFKFVRKGLLIIRAKKQMNDLSGAELIAEVETLFEKALEL